jgi:hypothetical protein
MQKYFRVPLFFLLVGSLLGVFLRWQFIAPTAGINYSFFLHGHSHIMFLGWVFNVLYIAFISNHVDSRHHRFYLVLFYILQILTIGMLISFPLQGYGLYSILFSTLHTICSIVFTIRFLIQTSGAKTISLWYARIALIFSIISAAGPFYLGYLMANNIGDSNWSNFSIYFYLHFQYNGFFFFGIIAMFFHQLENKRVHFNASRAKLSGLILAIACVPAYLLSTLWAKPGYLFNEIGAVSALIQFIGFLILLRLFVENAYEIKQRFKYYSLVLLSAALIALTLKLSLQGASAFPVVAQMANELRPVVIAYLHLVLVGMVTAFILAWYIEHDLVKTRLLKPAALIFLVAFSGMEIVLVVWPWWSSVSSITRFSAAEYCFAFAALLAFSYLLFILGSFLNKTDKNQSLN